GTGTGDRPARGRADPASHRAGPGRRRPDAGFRGSNGHEPLAPSLLSDIAGWKPAPGPRTGRLRCARRDGSARPPSGRTNSRCPSSPSLPITAGCGTDGRVFPIQGTTTLGSRSTVPGYPTREATGNAEPDRRPRSAVSPSHPGDPAPLASNLAGGFLGLHTRRSSTPQYTRPLGQGTSTQLDNVNYITGVW